MVIIKSLRHEWVTQPEEIPTNTNLPAGPSAVQKQLMNGRLLQALIGNLNRNGRLAALSKTKNGPPQNQQTNDGAVKIARFKASFPSLRARSARSDAAAELVLALLLEGRRGRKEEKFKQKKNATETFRQSVIAVTQRCALNSGGIEQEEAGELCEWKERRLSFFLAWGWGWRS